MYLLNRAQGPGVSGDQLRLGWVDANGILRAELRTDPAADARIVILYAHLVLFVQTVDPVWTDLDARGALAWHAGVDALILV
jgi:hypothetical protein